MGYPMTCQSGGTLDIFIEPVMPKSSIVVIGHTAIAEAICELVSASGYEVTVAARGGAGERFGSTSRWLQDLDDVSGLDIGARTPAEVALSILAGLVERRRQAVGVGDESARLVGEACCESHRQAANDFD